MNGNIVGKVVVITGASSGLQRLVDGSVERSGRIDVMRNNAGLMAHSPPSAARSKTGTR